MNIIQIDSVDMKKETPLVGGVLAEKDDFTYSYHLTQPDSFSQDQRINWQNMRDEGFIKIPRSVLSHPAYLSSPCEHKLLLIHLYERACFKEMQFDDHGKIIKLKPGQLIYTIRQLSESADIPKSTVHRAIVRFCDVKILGQEVGHTKTIITLLHYCTYDSEKKESGTRNGTRMGQEWDTKEERKNLRTTTTSSLVKSKEQHTHTPEEVCAFVEKCKKASMPFRDKALNRLIEDHGLKLVKSKVALYYETFTKQNLKARSPDGWLADACLKDY